MVGEASTLFVLGIAEHMSILILLRTSFVNMCLLWIFRDEPKVVRCNSSVVPFLKVHEGEIISGNYLTQGDALLNPPTASGPPEDLVYGHTLRRLTHSLPSCWNSPNLSAS